jgi:hypothetical protein
MTLEERMNPEKLKAAGGIEYLVEAALTLRMSASY